MLRSKIFTVHVNISSLQHSKSPVLPLGMNIRYPLRRKLQTHSSSPHRAVLIRFFFKFLISVCVPVLLYLFIKLIFVFWVVELCNLAEVCQRFGGPYCCHHQVDSSPLKKHKTTVFEITAAKTSNFAFFESN